MKFEAVKNNIINQISARWISERELALNFNQALYQGLGTEGMPRILNARVRRNISQSRHPDDANVVLGANCVHITWDIESSARKLASESQTILNQAIQWLGALLQEEADKGSNSTNIDLTAKKS